MTNFIKVKPVIWDYPLTKWFKKVVYGEETTLSVKEKTIREIRIKFNLTRKEAELCYEYPDLIIGKKVEDYQTNPY